MDKITVNYQHETKFPNAISIGDSVNNVEITNTGQIHFNGSAVLDKFHIYDSTRCNSIHQNSLAITSLTESNGIVTSGLTTSEDATRAIEVIGVDGGIQTKGILTDSYARHDTSEESNIVKVRLSTMYGTNTWVQASEWLLVLNIASGNGITGEFTIIMPPFNLLHYSTLEMYITIDGSTYLDKVMNGFDYSLSGTSAATEDFSNNEVAGDDVVIEVASTTGFYVGNQVMVSDSENSEWTRIKSLVSNTSITVTELTNSYTTANGAKFDQIDYIRTVTMSSLTRSTTRIMRLKADQNSGFVLQDAIPQEIDNENDIEINMQFIGSEDNAGAATTKWMIQYYNIGLFEDQECSLQYGTIKYKIITPTVTKYNWYELLCTVPASEYTDKAILCIEITRLGADAGDTYTGDIFCYGIMLDIPQNKLGYEGIY